MSCISPYGTPRLNGIGDRKASSEGGNSRRSSKASSAHPSQLFDVDLPTYQEDCFFAATGVAGAPTKNGMFIDAASMKEKLRQNICKPEYNVADFYHKEGLFRWLATHKIFEGATLAVIAFNAIYISLDTDYNHSDSLLGALPIFQLAEHFFCTYFSFEWFVRFMAFKKKRNGCRDAWFVFDSFMVCMMVGETWLMTVILLLTGAGGSGGMGNASILRLFRLLRLSRMARMARLLRAMPELMILIKGMVAATRSMGFTMLLLALLMYVFGIMFTQLLVDTAVGEVRFRTVPQSMHTLLLDGTLLDDIGAVIKDLSDESVIYPMIFYFFVLLSAFTVMNMLIGVLCEVVSNVATVEKEELTVNYVRERLEQVVSMEGVDENGDGEISKDEFCQILTNPGATRLLQEVGVDVCGLMDVADFEFEEFAEEDEFGNKIERNLNFGEFMEVVLKMRGSNEATVKDIVDLRKFVTKEARGVEDKLDRALNGDHPQAGSMRASRRLPTAPLIQVTPVTLQDQHRIPSNGGVSDAPPASPRSGPEMPLQPSRTSLSPLDLSQSALRSSLKPQRLPSKEGKEAVGRLEQLLKSSEAELSRLLEDVGQLLPMQLNGHSQVPSSSPLSDITPASSPRQDDYCFTLSESLQSVRPRPIGTCETLDLTDDEHIVDDTGEHMELLALASELRNLQTVLREDGPAVVSAVQESAIQDNLTPGQSEDHRERGLVSSTPDQERKEMSVASFDSTLCQSALNQELALSGTKVYQVLENSETVQPPIPLSARPVWCEGVPPPLPS